MKTGISRRDVGEAAGTFPFSTEKKATFNANVRINGQ